MSLSMEILLMIRLQTWIYTILAIVYFITIISCIVVVLSENRNPIKSLAWVTVLFFLPVAGLVCYCRPQVFVLTLQRIRKHSL